MRQVRDRERKYLARKTEAGRLKRRLEYAAAAKKRLACLPPATVERRGGGLVQLGEMLRTLSGSSGRG